MYAFTQDLPITTDVYARIMQGVGMAPANGCILHAVIRIDGGLRYIDIWESREACDRFLEERVHPSCRPHSLPPAQHCLRSPIGPRWSSSI